MIGDVIELAQLRPRRVEQLVSALLVDEPVVVMTGARTVGKSTVLRHLAAVIGSPVVDLDDLVTRALVVQDLAYYVAAPSPVLIDEFQHVPQLLDAIKAELNIEDRPGRFVLTGSTRYTSLPRAAQSLTGRVAVVTVWPMSQGEIDGTHETFVEQLLGDPGGLVDRSEQVTDRTEYIERVLAGGLPAALRRPAGRPRQRWYENYLQLVIERDVLDIARVRQSAALPLFLRRLASQTGQVLNVAAASNDVRLTATTGEDYVRLMESVFMLHRLPAWGTTLASRVNRLPKIHLVDTGLAGWLMGLHASQLAARDATALTEFGHLVETFVVNEILKQASWLDRGLRFGHYRTSDGHEVDLVIETDDGDVVAVEVKAGSTYRPGDMRGLSHLRDRIGSHFRAGVMLTTGHACATVGDRLHVIPLGSLWAQR